MPHSHRRSQKYAMQCLSRKKPSLAHAPPFTMDLIDVELTTYIGLAKWTLNQYYEKMDDTEVSTRIASMRK